MQALIGSILGSIAIYIFTFIDLKDAIKRDKIIAVVSFIISFIFIIGNWILSTTELAYLSFDFLTVISSSIPYLFINTANAKKLENEKKKLEQKIEEKKSLLLIIGDIAYGLTRAKKEYSGLLESIYIRIQYKYYRKQMILANKSSLGKNSRFERNLLHIALRIPFNVMLERLLKRLLRQINFSASFQLPTFANSARAIKLSSTSEPTLWRLAL